MHNREFYAANAFEDRLPECVPPNTPFCDLVFTHSELDALFHYLVDIVQTPVPVQASSIPRRKWE